MKGEHASARGCGSTAQTLDGIENVVAPMMTLDPSKQAHHEVCLQLVYRCITSFHKHTDAHFNPPCPPGSHAVDRAATPTPNSVSSRTHPRSSRLVKSTAIHNAASCISQALHGTVVTPARKLLLHSLAEHRAIDV